MSDLSDTLARALFGARYVAVVRMDYDDWHGRDSLTTEVTPFRARNRLAAACRAIRIAQREAEMGWESVHLEGLRRIQD